METLDSDTDVQTFAQELIEKLRRIRITLYSVKGVVIHSQMIAFAAEGGVLVSIEEFKKHIHGHYTIGKVRAELIDRAYECDPEINKRYLEPGDIVILPAGDIKIYPDA